MNHDQEWQEDRVGQTDELFSYLQGHVEETALDTESDYLVQNPPLLLVMVDIKQVVQLFLMSHLLKTTKCNHLTVSLGVCRINT